MKNVHLYKEHHSTHPRYGKSFKFHYPYIAALLNYLDAQSVIDYGCGKNSIADRLFEEGLQKAEKYDPAIPGIDTVPNDKFDCLVNTDVLEHIPEEELPQILENFKKLSAQAIIIPHLEKAAAILPNGENAHCTLKSPAEWRVCLQKYYPFVEQLPHHSKSHAMFLCGDHAFDRRYLERLCQIISSLRTEHTIKHFALNNPLGKRASMAVRILRGKKGFEKKQY
jgi:hypothetical protein